MNVIRNKDFTLQQAIFRDLKEAEQANEVLGKTEWWCPRAKGGKEHGVDQETRTESDSLDWQQGGHWWPQQDCFCGVVG